MGASVLDEQEDGSSKMKKKEKKKMKEVAGITYKEEERSHVGEGWWGDS